MFKNLHIAAECGLRTDYTVNYKYNVDPEENEGCQMIGDVCVFPAWGEAASFEMHEYARA